jgi:RHS repeat-associated protein
MSLYGWMYFFQGKRFDPTTGTYDSRRRVYSPTLRRPLQPDPLGLVPDINDYRWEDNGPVKHVDPLGLADTAPLELAGYVGQSWGDATFLLHLVQDASTIGISAVGVAILEARIRELNGQGPTPIYGPIPIQPPIRMVTPINPPLPVSVCPPANPPLPVPVGLPPVPPINPFVSDHIWMILGGLFFTIWDIMVYASNTLENEQFNRIVKDEQLTIGQAEMLHRQISKQGYTLEEIREQAKDIKLWCPKK